MNKYFILTLLLLLAGIVSTQAQNVHFEQGKQLLKAKQYRQAIDALKQATQAEPENVTYYLYLAKAYNFRLKEVTNFMKKGALANQMKRAYQKAVKADPQSIKARYALGMYYVNAPAIAGGSLTKAREQAEEVIKLDKYAGYIMLATLHKKNKKYKQAAQVYHACLPLTDKQAEVYLKLGFLYQEQKQYKQAFQALANAIRQDKTYLSAYYQYARTAVFAKMQLSQGVSYLKHYLNKISADDKQAPAPTYAWWRLGQLYELQQNPVKALQAYEKALQLNPENNRAQKALNNLKNTYK